MLSVMQSHSERGSHRWLAKKQNPSRSKRMCNLLVSYLSKRDFYYFWVLWCIWLPNNSCNVFSHCIFLKLEWHTYDGIPLLWVSRVFEMFQVIWGSVRARLGIRGQSCYTSLGFCVFFFLENHVLDTKHLWASS